MYQIKNILGINVSQNVVLYIYTQFQKRGFNNEKSSKIAEVPLSKFC